MRETRRIKYRADTSMLHSLHPVVKLICFILSAVTVLCAGSLLALALAAAFSASVIYLAQLETKEVVSAAKNMAPFLLLIFLINACFAYPQDAKYRFFFFTPTLPGAEKGLFIALRAFMLVLLCDVLSRTTPVKELTGAFAMLLYPMSLAGIPTAQAAFILSAAVEFIPFILSETERIRFAQSTRGAAEENGNHIAKIENALRSFLPTLMSSFRRAEKLSLSMEARGGCAEKPFLPERKPDKYDVCALIVCLAVFLTQIVIL